MSSHPGPTRPGGPTKSGMTPLLKILLGLLAGGVALVMIVAVAGYYLVRRAVHISESPSGKGVEIQSPIGSLRVNKEPPEAVLARLGIPAYPGATPGEHAAQLSITAGEEGAKVTVVELETRDPLDKVDAFYRQELGGRFKRQTGEMIDWGDHEGRSFRHRRHAKDAILYSEEKDAKNTFVALEKKGQGTKIAIARVIEREAQ